MYVTSYSKILFPMKTMITVTAQNLQSIKIFLTFKLSHKRLSRVAAFFLKISLSLPTVTAAD